MRGTKWLTEDLCGATRITVVEGTVRRPRLRPQRRRQRPGGPQLPADALPRGVRNAGCTVVGTEQRDFLRGTSGQRRDLRARAATTSSPAWAGNDRLIGGPGNDRILAGPGDDVLIGNAGKDFLKGAPATTCWRAATGNDFMAAHDGGRGNDRLTGGLGRDLCYTD